MTHEQEILGAIRLALAGAANDRAAIAVIRTLLEDPPESDPRDTGSVHRLLEAVKRSRCEIVVTDAEQR